MPAKSRLSINTQTYDIQAARLSFSVDSPTRLTWTFDLRSKEKNGLQPTLEADGYLPLLRPLSHGEAQDGELSAEDAEQLVLYVHDHLPFRRARATLIRVNAGRYALDIDGEVRDFRAAKSQQQLRVRARTELPLDQVSVPPDNEREARSLLASTGLLDCAKGFVWTKLRNGVCVFLSPRAARSHEALRKLEKQLSKLTVPRICKAVGLPTNRQALWARPAQVRRAKRALRAELQRRFPDDVRALIPFDAVWLADQVSGRL